MTLTFAAGCSVIIFASVMYAYIGTVQPDPPLFGDPNSWTACNVTSVVHRTATTRTSG